MNELLKAQYGYLFSPELLQEIEELGVYREFKAGEEIMDYGVTFKHLPLLLDGAIRILRENENGQELLLYFLERGDTCAFTLNCCMGSKQSEVRAEAETDVKLVMIPIQKLDEWMVKYDEWRAFVMQSYFERVNELLDVVDAMAFQQLDQRVYQFLKDKAMVSGDTNIIVTHQELASHLNSSRVVISRLLKKLENQGKIEIGRNQIKLLDF
ncbi:Crp/Fnr family transcriptional regulator [Weeksellaceae bacterium KMM 9724]|uniref:Crp/Fnr family transcriptional regulator n=1 Tax=Profundicola chukchiensis TaxID=2961959 RepID=UPI002439A26B|nr:Crp/Fnr family transcriptional regulator [Profundicola chukchiensis]MDG4951473.1 Crp/Fnr family transcriptional regulator [Profundicola chukchiensis]